MEIGDAPSSREDEVRPDSAELAAMEFGKIVIFSPNTLRAPLLSGVPSPVSTAPDGLSSWWKAAAAILLGKVLMPKSSTASSCTYKALADAVIVSSVSITSQGWTPTRRHGRLW